MYSPYYLFEFFSKTCAVDQLGIHSWLLWWWSRQHCTGVKQFLLSFGFNPGRKLLKLKKFWLKATYGSGSKHVVSLRKPLKLTQGTMLLTEDIEPKLSQAVLKKLSDICVTCKSSRELQGSSFCEPSCTLCGLLWYIYFWVVPDYLSHPSPFFCK